MSTDQRVASELKVESTVLISEANKPHNTIPFNPIGKYVFTK